MSSNPQTLAELFGDDTSVPPPPLQERLKRWAELTERKRNLELQLRLVQDDLGKLEPGLLEDMAESGMQSAKVDGLLIYKQREFYAKLKEGVDKAAVIAKFQEAGLTHCLGLQHQTLRAMAREWAEAGESVPEAVSGMVELGDTFRLRARKG